MKICSLASGSNGNAMYLESDRTGASILIDCGISRLQIVRRLESIGRKLEDVNAIFISHEHTDHTRGLNITCKLFDIPIYLTRGSFQGLRDTRYLKRIQIIAQSGIIRIDDLTVAAIPKSHDAAEPTSFAVTCDDRLFVHATDFGEPNEDIIRLIQQANAILLEMNYDETMLAHGPYPYWLQQRIKSARGHMSNLNSAELILKYASSALSLLILGHMSENNNCPDIAHRAINKMLQQRDDLHPTLHIASRYEASELIDLS